MATEVNDEVPRFLNSAYVENLMKKIVREKVKVVKYTVNPVAKKGNHYGSIVLRMVVDYTVGFKEQKQISLILKTGYDDKYNEEGGVKFTKEFDFQKREVHMYGKVLDCFHDLLSSINDKTTFSCRCYTIDRTTNTTILEDLLVRQYRCANRIERLDLNHTKLILKKLAKFHACSVILKKKEPNVYEPMEKALFSRDGGDARDFCLALYDAGIDFVSKWPGYEYYVNKMKQFRKKFVEKGIEMCELDKDFNVLLHGDMWNMNTMFKYDHDGNPVDVLFVDYQVPYYASPAIDLMYFIHSSIKEDLRLEKQDELVQYYYKHLKETLIDGFKYDGKFPSLLEFQIIVLKKSPFIIVSLFVVLPICLLTEGTDANLITLISQDEEGVKFREKMFNSSGVAEAIKKMLPYLDAKGVFD
ncbi:hypothetical protein DMENIID0001_032410 [Sergentomyia squamirostris]